MVLGENLLSLLYTFAKNPNPQNLFMHPTIQIVPLLFFCLLLWLFLFLKVTLILDSRQNLQTEGSFKNQAHF